jgi:hypothetical protein
LLDEPEIACQLLMTNGVSMLTSCLSTTPRAPRPADKRPRAHTRAFGFGPVVLAGVHI